MIPECKKSQKKFENVDNFLILRVAQTNITNNSDLNDYIEPGTYYSANAGISATLTNCPATASAFKLITEQLARTDRYRQTIYTNSPNSDTYVRTYSTDGWGSWMKIKMESV